MADELQIAFSDQLMDKLISVDKALPKNFNKDRFTQNTLAFMNDHPELARLNKAQVINGLLKGAYMSLDYSMGEAYLIPYGNSVQFQVSYKGEIKFTKRYSIRPIRDIYAKVVRKGDEFTETIVNGQPVVNFSPIPFNDDEIVGAFAVVNYQDGGMDYEVMSTKDINAVRNNYSKVANSGAWKKSWDEMAKKTVLRRLCKHIETDFETVEAMKAWEEGSDFDGNKKPETSEVIANPFKAQIIEEDGTITEEIVESEGDNG